MSKKKYTVESLKKLSKEELQEIATGLTISFTEEDTKAVLAEAIVAEEARIEAEANEGLSEEEKETLKRAAEEAAKANVKTEELVEYTLPETCKTILDTNGKRYTREEALKNQALLAKLKKLGHKAISVKK